MTPSESMLKVILNFPIPRTLTDAWSWFGLVNQVTWVYSLGPVILPFCDLVKRDSHFAWNKSLEDAFQRSKEVIVDLVHKGIATFEKDWVTCLALNWSKEGMGFLILQKQCSVKSQLGWEKILTWVKLYDNKYCLLKAYSQLEYTGIVFLSQLGWMGLPPLGKFPTQVSLQDE